MTRIANAFNINKICNSQHKLYQSKMIKQNENFEIVSIFASIFPACKSRLFSAGIDKNR